MGKLLEFRQLQDGWASKLGWARARKVAEMVGYDETLYRQDQFKWALSTRITEKELQSKEFYVFCLMNNIYGLVHEWKPVKPLESLPLEVQRWYAKARLLAGNRLQP